MEGDRQVPELKGIIPNSFAHIFGHIAKAEENIKFLVRYLLLLILKLHFIKDWTKFFHLHL